MAKFLRGAVGAVGTLLAVAVLGAVFLVGPARADGPSTSPTTTEQTQAPADTTQETTPPSSTRPPASTPADSSTTQAPSTSTEDPVGTGTLTVTVISSETGENVPGARMQVNESIQIVAPATVTVPAGHVGVTALSAPPGYRYDEGGFRSVDVPTGGQAAVSFSVRRVGDTGTLTIRSVDDATGDSLPGQGATVRIGGADVPVTTDATFPAVPGPVTVTADMDHTVPGYLPVDRVLHGVVTPGQHTTLTFRLANHSGDQGRLTVVKRDRVTGERLAGATYQVVTCADRRVLGTFTTGADGTFTAAFRSPVTLCVVETGAPDGYELDGSAYQVNLTPRHTTVIALYDTPLSYVKVRGPDVRVPLRSIPTGRTQ